MTITINDDDHDDENESLDISINLLKSRDAFEAFGGITTAHRHAPREDWDNPITAGALARWILWNKETLPSSIKDYTRRFNLAAV